MNIVFWTFGCTGVTPFATKPAIATKRPSESGLTTVGTQYLVGVRRDEVDRLAPRLPAIGRVLDAHKIVIGVVDVVIGVSEVTGGIEVQARVSRADHRRPVGQDRHSAAVAGGDTAGGLCPCLAVIGRLEHRESERRTARRPGGLHEVALDRSVGQFPQAGPRRIARRLRRMVELLRLVVQDLALKSQVGVRVSFPSPVSAGLPDKLPAR